MDRPFFTPPSLEVHNPLFDKAKDIQPLSMTQQAAQNDELIVGRMMTNAVGSLQRGI